MILEKRKILTSTSDDQLRWGRNSEGNFNLRESKRIATRFNYLSPDKIWKDLWQNPHWVKIKLFMWLVQQKNILTWENIRKRGFVGPSRCLLCGLQEETMDHLLNLCSFTSNLWNWVAPIFKQTDRDENDITKTLKNWRKDFSDHETVNIAWTLIPGFLIWDVWKKCNNRIFNDKSGSTQSIIAQISRQIKENVNALLKEPPEKSLGHQKAHILELLGLQVLAPKGIRKSARHTIKGKAFWKPPPHSILKFNIDGASKGNPGDAGYRGVLRDEQGNIKFIFHSHLGNATNNMAELMAIEQCLETLIDSNSQNIIIEADSELTINLVKKIGTGSAPDKVSNHWRLVQVYHRIQSHLRILRTLSFVHVHRNTNKLVDQLANEGVLCTKDNQSCPWESVPIGKLREDCYTLASVDREHYQFVKEKQLIKI